MPRTSSRSPLKPRRAPRQGRSEQTVAILIEAAALVLESEGLGGYNTNAVALRAGVSIGSLYQYFPSKDALTIALMRRENALFFEQGRKALDRDNGRLALERYLDAAVRQQLARPRLAKLLDIQESRPELGSELRDGDSLRGLLETAVANAATAPHARLSVVVSDLSTIVRGMTDGAGERGETDLGDLRVRIGAAVFGYLQAISAIDQENTSKPAPKNDTPP